MNNGKQNTNDKLIVIDEDAIYVRWIRKTEQRSYGKTERETNMIQVHDLL